MELEEKLEKLKKLEETFPKFFWEKGSDRVTLTGRLGGLVVTLDLNKVILTFGVDEAKVSVRDDILSRLYDKAKLCYNEQERAINESNLEKFFKELDRVSGEDNGIRMA